MVDKEETPPARFVQINGDFVTVRGTQILDSWEVGAGTITEAKALIETVEEKIRAENWSPEEGAVTLFYVDVILHGFRDMTPTETALVAEWDRTQSDEYQQYIKLKEKYG